MRTARRHPNDTQLKAHRSDSSPDWTDHSELPDELRALCCPVLYPVRPGVETADDLFDVVANGHVKVSVNQTYALKDAAQAHIDLEARKTTGSTIFLP